MMGEKDDDSVVNVIEHELVTGDCEYSVDSKAFGDDDIRIKTSCFIGMEFETKEMAYSFYSEYARSIGFGITIRASRRSKKSGKFIDIKIVCSRFGTRKSNTSNTNERSCPKTDCRAGMHIKRKSDEKWYIFGFVEQHNHEIYPGNFFNAVRGRYDKHNTNRECLKKGLQLALNGRDVQLLLDFLILTQAENPGFYYVIDFDKETRMRNVFWINQKGRNDYVHFGDVVLFDTYYIRNKHRVPLIPVIGVSHHLQYILLGCALIGDESPSSLAWLMRTWVRAVGGQSPKVVITDTDKLLSEAVVQVFPDAYHCFCPWHLFRDLACNLNQKLCDFDVFLRKFKNCLYKSRTNNEFEKRWQKMVLKFDLTDNKWMQSLYEDREKWEPTFMRDIFLGGFFTLERSHSVASSLDKYLKKDDTVEEFIDQYKLCLREICEEEAKANTEIQQVERNFTSHSSFEKQMSKIYTNAIYRKFQAEVSGIVSCSIVKISEDDTLIVFRVNEVEMKETFNAEWNKKTCSIFCQCRLCELNGFLCRHALSVLQLFGVFTIPSNYILKRWTVEARIRDVTRRASTKMNFRIERFNDLCKLAVKLGETGSLTREAYEVARDALREAVKQSMITSDSMRYGNGQKETDGIPEASNSKKVSKRRKVQVEAETSSNVIQGRDQDIMELLNQRSPHFHISHPDFQGMGGLSDILSVNNHHVTHQNLKGQMQGHFSFNTHPLKDVFRRAHLSIWHQVTRTISVLPCHYLLSQFYD